MSKLARHFNVESIGENQSIIVLENIRFYSKSGFRAGQWYDFQLDFFKHFKLSNKENEVNSRILLVLHYNGKDKLKPKEHSTFIQEYKKLKITSYKDMSEIQRIFESEDNSFELIVRNVGCGNWNEIKSSDFHMIYDLGGDIKFSNSKMAAILNQINFYNHYIAILSHWDLDHYRAILDLEERDLNKMNHFIAPSKIPDTVQARKTIERLQKLSIPIIILLPTPRMKRVITLGSIFRRDNFELYRSCDGSSMNMSGIVVTIEGKRKKAILTGDHHYSQIRRDVLQQPSSKCYELVVPHHAGGAGTFKEAYLDAYPCLSGAISTQSGRYKNLPQKKVHAYFLKRNFHCTCCTQSDYRTLL